MSALKPKVITIPQSNTAGSAFNDVHISGSNLTLQTDSDGILTGSNSYFLKNTTTGKITTIAQYDSIFNPFNLLIKDSHIFIIETNADYYVLGDLTNSGSIVVNGTLKIGGALLNIGSIVGDGIIE
jgi:hypothetical protein